MANIESNFSAQIENSKFCFGLFLVVIGIAMPLYLDVYNFNVYDTLILAIRESDKSYLVIAAFNLVMLNSIRGLPHYLGAFVIAESVHIKHKQKYIRGMRAIISFTIIPLVYTMIDEIYNIKYDFGNPALIVVLALVLIGQMDDKKVNIVKKSIILILISMSMQWLDIVPMLSHFAFGRGEMSSLIKSAAVFIEAEDFIQGTALLFFTIFFLGSIMAWKLILDEQTMKKINERNQENEKALVETQLRVIEDRTYKEIQNVVHDLKTPLTSMQALVGVLKMTYEQDEKTIVYLTKIEKSIDRLSQMISDILYENSKSYTTTEELFTSIQSQISNLEYVKYVRLVNNVPLHKICINKTRFYRAIINIIENSFYAIEKDKGRIDVTVDEFTDNEKEYLTITVSDNGVGIEQEVLDSIWDRGYSSRNTTGFGLNFVKTVIENHGGTIDIDSQCGVGTTTTLIIPM